LIEVLRLRESHFATTDISGSALPARRGSPLRQWR
jgi:hypothetical protein